jgi:transcriptional regulator with XRE-family HTH domain
MKDKEIIKAAMTARGYSQTFLAKEKLGFATPSGVSERLRGKQSMRVDTFVKFLKAMDFEVVVRSKTSSKEEWTVNFE